MKIRTAIVDDEPLARQLIRNLLEPDPEVEIVAECGEGREAVTALRRARPDLVFLDVQMPGASGFDVIEALGERVPYVIFVTAHDRYALRAFDVQAVDYLLKPVGKERFLEGLARAKASIRDRGLAELAGEMAESYGRLRETLDALRPGGPSRRTEFMIRDGRRLISIPVSEVRWIEAANQYARLHARDGEHLLSESLTAIESGLDPRRFCRIHRSTLVNVEFVTEVRAERDGGCAVLLADGTRLRVSRGRRQALSTLLRHPR